MPVDTEGKLSQWAIKAHLGLIAVFGLCLILFSYSPAAGDLNELWRGLANEVGKALVAAATLGFVVDEALKRDLIRNAVASALGYLVPDELKDELRWVYDQKFMVEQTLNIRLEHDVKDRRIVFHGHYSRVIRNNSGEKAQPDVHGGVDEWFSPTTEATITRCGITRNGTFTPIKTMKNLTGVGYTCDGLEELEPKEFLQVEMAYTFSTVENGMEILTHNYPISRPIVQLDIPPTLRARVVFSHRAKDRGSYPPESGNFTRRLDGVLLPHTDIRIYWNLATDLDARSKTLLQQA